MSTLFMMSSARRTKGGLPLPSVSYIDRLLNAHLGLQCTACENYGALKSLSSSNTCGSKTLGIDQQYPKLCESWTPFYQNTNLSSSLSLPLHIRTIIKLYAFIYLTTALLRPVYTNHWNRMLNLSLLAHISISYLCLPTFATRL